MMKNCSPFHWVTVYYRTVTRFRPLVTYIWHSQPATTYQPHCMRLYQKSVPRSASLSICFQNHVLSTILPIFPLKTLYFFGFISSNWKPVVLTYFDSYFCTYFASLMKYSPLRPVLPNIVALHGGANDELACV